MKDNGCYGCTERKVGCHSKCERYLKWKEEYDKKAKLKRAGENKYHDFFYHKGKMRQM